MEKQDNVKADQSTEGTSSISEKETNSFDSSQTLQSSEYISDKKEVTQESATKIEKKPNRNPIVISKIGSDHLMYNKNNQDFALTFQNMRLILDGCGSGKHSEVGVQLFAQFFKQKAEEYSKAGTPICPTNIIEVIDSIFSKLLTLSNDIDFVFDNYCFTILLCFELEDEFVVYSCGDGYILKDNNKEITFEKLDDGEYPAYYIYNFIEDKSLLCTYQEGVTFQIAHYSKNNYSNVGVASDGLRFYSNLMEVELNRFMRALHNGIGAQIIMLINRNNRKTNLFHDDISICF